MADSWQKFKSELAKRGVHLELVYKDKERTKVQGIRFCKDGYSFKGTQISRDYSFGKLNARFEGTENRVSARAKSMQGGQPRLSPSRTDAHPDGEQPRPLEWYFFHRTCLLRLMPRLMSHSQRKNPPRRKRENAEEGFSL